MWWLQSLFATKIFGQVGTGAGHWTWTRAWQLIPQLRFIVPKWISYEDSLNSCEWNFTLNGETVDCHTSPNNPGESGETKFFLSLDLPDSTKRFSFADILRFKITFTVDPEGNLPNGKGDMPSMIVAYPMCNPTIWSISTSYRARMCGPFKGMPVKWNILHMYICVLQKLHFVMESRIDQISEIY